MVSVRPDTNYAGDVNGDGMIDNMDVMLVVAQYGKNDKAADINIDELDIRFIDKKFLKSGKMPIKIKNQSRS